MIRRNHKRKQSGVAILFAVILISVALSAAFALSLVFVPKIRLSSRAKDSVAAFYSADSAAEWCLYVNRKGVVAGLVMANGATYTATPADCASFPMKLLGTYRGVTRAVEISF